MSEQLSGCELIANERQRQIEAEGWTASHDDEHRGGELALAACCYASPERLYLWGDSASGFYIYDPWPWESSHDKRLFHDGRLVANRQLRKPKRIDLLVKAGALIAAEIDRLQRLNALERSAHRGASTK